jgi:flagellar export protein FliJ
VRRYRFRLAPVLRVRRAEEERARAELQLANREVFEAAATLEAREAHFRALPASTPHVSPEELARERDVASMAAAAVIAARHHLHDAHVRAAQRAEAWHAASMRVKALDRLDERQRDEHAVEMARDEARTVDEMVMGRRLREAAQERAVTDRGGAAA